MENLTLQNRLVFNKCFCCNKNFILSQLIDLNENSVYVGGETISFDELILDVCLILIDVSTKSFICEECKNQLVLFHMFKRDVKKYSSFQKNLQMLHILSKVEKSLNYSSNIDEFVIKQCESSVIISPKEEIHNIERILKTDETIIHDSSDEVHQDTANEPEYVEEYIEEIIKPEEVSYDEIEEAHDESIRSEDFHELVECRVASPIAESKIKIESYRKPKQQGNQKYKYPINTNDKLTEEQKDWIREQVRESEIMIDGKINFKCSLCNVIIQISGTLKKHLRDCHLLKSEKALEIANSRREFKEEIRKSKIILKTSNGIETIWKCQRCDSDRIFRSETGLKVHIRYNHIRNQVIDAKFIANCKISLETENGLKNAWKCPECEKILMSRDGLRNHMKSEHPNTLEGNRTYENNISLKHDNSGDFQSEILLNLLEKKRRTLNLDTFSGICEECGVQFINGTSKKESSSKIHHECHKILNIVAQYYQLPKCDVSKVMFSNDVDLERFSSSQEFFTPTPCDGMTAKVSQKLKDPIGNANPTDENAWQCGHCGVKYQTEIDCKSHVMILHSKKFICPVDHMEFEGSRGISLFNAHMYNRHPDMFPNHVISCTYCHEEFASIFEKLSHMKTCNEKKFECDHCSKKFFTKTQLIRHLKIVSGDISYVCDVCWKSCASTMDLKLHRLSHTNQKPYVCSYPECNKAFKTPTARSSHMETHSNISFSCSLCSATFRQRNLLQRHLKKGSCKGKMKHFVVEEIIEENQLYDVSEISN
ncbi:CLUMA_CG020738, isoform A [Clunio marinus]|uniref:CLUMA_CG020738, isoform A n=1 Tax=Clunio marinus TaxID=568069 RepID=A0A1J1J5V9_9DIPT|nr:CLUMA_CG020738, isoform A [Clunio marinus]